jgi:DNA-binding MarR family transcriptional regulator
MKDRFSTSFDPDTIDEVPEKLDIEEKATYLNQTSMIVLENFQRISYPTNLAVILGKDESTIRYHIEKLLYLNLIDFYRETQDRKYFKITEEGLEVCEALNIPE